MSKLNKTSLSILFLVVATELIGFGLIIPVLPQIAEQFQVSGLHLGILFGAYSFAQFFACPLLGHLSDRFGRKPVLVLSKFGTVIAYIVLGLSGNYWLFLCARLIDGFTGGNISVARAYIVDSTTAQNRARGMAIIGISFGVGFLLGPALGGFLFGMFEHHMIPSFIAGGFSFIAMLLTLFFLKEPQVHKVVERPHFSSIFALIKTRSVGIICLTHLVFMIVFSSFEVTLSVFTDQVFQLTLQQNSFLFLFIGCVAFIVQGGILRKQFKNLKLAVILGIFLMAIQMIGLSLITGLIQLLFLLVLSGLGIGLVLTHLPALISLYIPLNQAGSGMGFYESIGSFSRVVGPLIIYTGFYHQLRVGYVFCAISLLVVGFLFTIILPAHSKQAQ